jgi:hypothetical protein
MGVQVLLLLLLLLVVPVCIHLCGWPVLAVAAAAAVPWKRQWQTQAQ